MTRPPFGFGPADRPDDEPGGGDDPFGLSAMFGGAGGPFGGDMGSVFAQMQKLMSWTGGPVNWDLADEVATGATRAGDVPVTAEQTRQVADACRLADLWLDAVTTLPGERRRAAGLDPHRAGSTSTTPAWRALVDPVAGRVVGAMGTALEQGLGGAGGLPEGLPPEVAGLLGGLGGGRRPRAAARRHGPGRRLRLRRAGRPGARRARAGGAVGDRDRAAAVGARQARRCCRRTSRPSAPGSRCRPTRSGSTSRCASWPTSGCSRSVPWLQAHLFDAVDAYARGIEVDPGAIERAVGSIDPSDPESMQRAMGEGLFEIEPTPAQQAALARLETALALVEGWVDAVVDAACSGDAAVRGRAARDGPPPAGLRRPGRADLRHARRAAAAAPPAARGGGAVGGRRRARRHAGPRRPVGPPRPAAVGDDLDDPAGFVARTAAGAEAEVDWDAGLRGLDKDFDGTLDDDASGGPAEQ